MADTVDFVLASTSPRRRALLEQIGARFAVAAVAVDETPYSGEAPEEYVSRLARAKATAGALALPALPVLAADTTVAVEGQLLGKPADEQQAVAMLMALSAGSHSVHTAVAMVFGERVELRHSHTRVHFRGLDPEECRTYWRTGEPADKAGGYAIQGLGAVFVKAIEGSYSGVVGLPLAPTWELLQLFAIPCWQRARVTQ